MVQYIFELANNLTSSKSGNKIGPKTDSCATPQESLIHPTNTVDGNIKGSALNIKKKTLDDIFKWLNLVFEGD